MLANGIVAREGVTGYPERRDIPAKRRMRGIHASTYSALDANAANASAFDRPLSVMSQIM